MHANPKQKKKRQKEERELEEEEDHLGQEILIPEKNAFMHDVMKDPKTWLPCKWQ
jgi:hypothetical protein